MAFLGKGKKEDVVALATELEIDFSPNITRLDLTKLITSMTSYDEEFVKVMYLSLLDEKDKEKDQKMKMDLEMEKLRLESEAFTNLNVKRLKIEKEFQEKTGIPNLTPTLYEPKVDLCMHKFDGNDISLYLILFERQARRAKIKEELWVSYLIGLLPPEITQIIARESEEKAQEYMHIKQILLSRFKLTPEKFRQLFYKHNKKKDQTWQDFFFELQTYFDGWLNGLSVDNFDKLKNLMIVEQLKQKIPTEFQEFYLDEWATLTSPSLLAAKIEEFEDARKTIKNRVLPFDDRKKNLNREGQRLPYTASGLLSTHVRSCIFCNGPHDSWRCFKAEKMKLHDKQELLRKKGCCFKCFQKGHLMTLCRANVTCSKCKKNHYHIMCPELNVNKLSHHKNDVAESTSSSNSVELASMSKSVQFDTSPPKVFLQTLKAVLVSEQESITVRVLFDTGSQRTYVRKEIVERLKYKPLRTENMIHSLFGGLSTKEASHEVFKLELSNLNGGYTCNFEALSLEVLCGDIFPVSSGEWLQELAELGIKLTDVSISAETIDIIIGADILGKLYTGCQKLLLCGMSAIETYLGWTLMGKVPKKNNKDNSVAMVVTSLFVKEADISCLWRLDLIGINDPVERKSKKEIDLQTKGHFLETVAVNSDNRYEVCLPWTDDTPSLPDNLHLAKKRLEYTTSKLKDANICKEYEDVFLSWLEEGIIEEIPQNEVHNHGSYLPHHPVIKPSNTTTPIRPVFDASAKLPNHPSLNQCLECGPNLIELLPDLLLRFRERKFGVIGDIRKAFCQISVRPQDRDFLRFLWWENVEEKKLRYFRHTRVVFGVNCSPFLLASVIDYHIQRSDGYDSLLREKLARSFYVDNVITSVDDREELGKFIEDSTALMSKGGFQLRDWEYSGQQNENKDKIETHVLGLIWNKELDVLKIHLDWIKDVDTEKVTKRSMLSMVHRIFDPFGFVSPVMLCPKIMLQKAWKKGIGWDEEIKGELRREYLVWLQELAYLRDIEIPRNLLATEENLSKCALHTFVDGSQDAYAAVTFLTIQKEDRVDVSFLAAKSRVSSLKATTIPRMELLAAVIGARLANSIIEALHWENIEKHFWSDSTTVLAWIWREENWSVFVRNRVQEIRKLSKPTSWKHVPGEKNPADLPSRGCKAKRLLSLKWWEGPRWLTEQLGKWETMPTALEVTNEEAIEREMVKSSRVLANIEQNRERWYSLYFGKYESIVRVVGWVLRFVKNCRTSKDTCEHQGHLTAKEFEEAELMLWKTIQMEVFAGVNDPNLKSLAVFQDDGLLRVKTQIIYRNDSEAFRKPIIIPSNHDVVHKLIMFHHVKNSHCGVQILLNVLREQFWLLRGRKAVQKVISKCVACKRHMSRRLEAVPAPLPENRIRDAAAFQITGVDAAGPLFLKGGRKVWVLLFTCAVYRGIHLELVTSMSTEAFLMAFRRFVARRGRCSTIYCDNGKNFVGAENLLCRLNWERIVSQSSINAIEWRFNPPTAAWWGGMWERMIRTLKDLLKKVLGRASLSYEELLTSLCDCESTVNSRPLTYVSERDADLVPISPSMFMQDIKEWRVPDIDEIDSQSLNRRLKYRQELQKQLRSRFRTEYLGQLVQRRDTNKKDYKNISVGDIVLIGSDNSKRINWPLGKVVSLIPGKDEKVRLVRVKTTTSTFLRPIQRLYPLELSATEIEPLCNKSESTNQDLAQNEGCIEKTRRGRQIRKPSRLNL